MPKKNLIKNIISIVLNTFIIFAVIFSILSLIKADLGFGNGISCFKYFTIDSNILMAATALITIIYSINNIVKNNEEYPKWLILLKQASTTGVMLTFTTVMCYLGIIYGYGLMLQGGNLYLHLIVPLVSLITYTLLENKPILKTKSIFIGLAPTILYGLVYVIFVFILKVWDDVYHFNNGGLWYIILPLMVVGTFVISLLIHLIRKALIANKKAQ